ncbi:hypothetical protein [Roseimaritima sediminicola]|uniref:hypothetical protein n=1 Tax=Roseimaritima sediminicola TaxID=2662066 RepID=UPI0013872718|nr:hypothetical protein [Roseimaritima sediminicola]
MANSMTCFAATVDGVIKPRTNNLPVAISALPCPTIPPSDESWSARIDTCSADASMPESSNATGPQPPTFIKPPV